MSDIQSSRIDSPAPSETDAPSRPSLEMGASPTVVNGARVLVVQPHDPPIKGAREVGTLDTDVHPGLPLRKIGPTLQAGLRIGL